MALSCQAWAFISTKISCDVIINKNKNLKLEKKDNYSPQDFFKLMISTNPQTLGVRGAKMNRKII